MTTQTNIIGNVAAKTIRVKSGQIDFKSTLTLAVAAGIFRFAQHIIHQSNKFRANNIYRSAVPCRSGRKDWPLPNTWLLSPARLACAALFVLTQTGCATRSVAPGPTISDMTVRSTGNEPSLTVFERSAETFVGESEVLSILVLLRGQLGRSISEEEAVVLYAWYRASSSLREKIASRFEPAKSLVAQLTVATLDQRLAQAFLPLSLGGSAVAVRWSAPAAEIARAADPPSAAPPDIKAAPAAPHATPAAPAALRILRVPILTVR